MVSRTDDSPPINEAHKKKFPAYTTVLEIPIRKILFGGDPSQKTLEELLELFTWSTGMVHKKKEVVQMILLLLLEKPLSTKELMKQVPYPEQVVRYYLRRLKKIGLIDRVNGKYMIIFDTFQQYVKFFKYFLLEDILSNLEVLAAAIDQKLGKKSEE